MTQEQRTREALAIYDALTPDNRRQLVEIMQQMNARQERQRAAIQWAIRRATFEDVEHGMRVLERAKLIEGDTIIEHYATCPNALAGLAYVAGIVEGKQRERDRRRHAAVKRAIREAARAARLAASTTGE